MKTIGLVGGMTPESTRVYYDLLTQGARQPGAAILSATPRFSSTASTSPSSLRFRAERTGERWGSTSATSWSG